MTFYYIPALKYSIIVFILLFCFIHTIKYVGKLPYYHFLKAKLGDAFGNIAAQVELGGFIIKVSWLNKILKRR